MTVNVGGPRRRDLSWWLEHGEATELNPYRIALRDGPIHRSDVRRYKADPDHTGYDATPVCVVELRDGTLFAREGAHRVTAAREVARTVSALVVTERAEQGWWG